MPAFLSQGDLLPLSEGKKKYYNPHDLAVNSPGNQN